MIRKLVRKLGFDIVRYPYRFKKRNLGDRLKLNRVLLIEKHGIDLILDVGANIGQFGRELRKNGYRNQIISFEPLKDAFAKLKETAAGDVAWEVYNFAIGDKEGTATINVAGNLVSSSLLPMEKAHEESAPESKYIRTEEIAIKSLDQLFDNYRGYQNIYLKLDVQGFEKNVLEGIANNFNRIAGIQTEMSLVTLYKGEETFFDYSSYLMKHGFRLMSLEPGFYDVKTGQLLQVDSIWYR
jgi:FkbM family methyltransferase